MKLFEFDVHIGDWRVLVQSNDIQNGAIQSRHISDNAVTNNKIGDGEVKSRNIQDNAVTTAKIGDGEVKTKNIGKEAVTNEKIADDAITGDEIHGSTVQNGKIANNAVQTRNIKDRNVTGSKLALGLLRPEHFTPATIQDITQDLQNQIDSIQVAGYAMSNEFGTGLHIGISQQKLTNTINTLYNLLEEALGRTLRGFTWTVTPTYIYGEWPTSVHITAQPVTLGDVFEHITLKVNGEVVDQVDEQISTYSFDVPLQVSANIHLDAQILGIPYYREQLVSHYDSFWLGAGTAYTDIMDEAHNINISQGSRIARNITAADNDHIFIIIGEAWVPSFIRADMNGVEIPFTEQTVTIDGKTYKVLTSEDSYQAGTYNIDING